MATDEKDGVSSLPTQQEPLALPSLLSKKYVWYVTAATGRVL